MLEEIFGTSWPTVRPLLATTWIDTGPEPSVPVGFTWSYAIDVDRKVVRDIESAPVPQILEGTKSLPNGWYPTEPTVAIPFAPPD